MGGQSPSRNQSAHASSLPTHSGHLHTFLLVSRPASRPRSKRYNPRLPRTGTCRFSGRASHAAILSNASVMGTCPRPRPAPWHSLSLRPAMNVLTTPRATLPNHLPSRVAGRQPKHHEQQWGGSEIGASRIQGPKPCESDVVPVGRGTDMPPPLGTRCEIPSIPRASGSANPVARPEDKGHAVVNYSSNHSPGLSMPADPELNSDLDVRWQMPLWEPSAIHSTSGSNLVVCALRLAPPAGPTHRPRGHCGASSFISTVAPPESRSTKRSAKKGTGNRRR